MEAYRMEKILPQNGVLIIDNLPFKPNDLIEIILLCKKTDSEKDRYPLRGKLVEYDDPFSPVALEDWDVLQ